MDPIQILRDFGWLGVFLLIVLPRLWSFIADRWYPDRQKVISDRRKAMEEADRAERQARATLLNAQLQREAVESERRLKLEERMTTAIEQISLSVVTANEKITALFASHTQHANFAFGAHVELKDRLDDIQSLIQQEQRIDDLEKKVTDTQQKIKRIEKEERE